MVFELLFWVAIPLLIVVVALILFLGDRIADQNQHSDKPPQRRTESIEKLNKASGA
jgi:hypothetical protein